MATERLKPRRLGIQDAYQQPTTEGLRKYGKRLITSSRIHEYAGYAFRQLRSGVPRPVHLDFPAEIASALSQDGFQVRGESLARGCAR